MPYYVKKALDRLQHTKPKRPQYAPHSWTVPTYVKRLEMAPDPNNSNIIDKKSHRKNTVYCGDTDILCLINLSDDATSN